jgi:hypothetical protein
MKNQTGERDGSHQQSHHGQPPLQLGGLRLRILSVGRRHTGSTLRFHGIVLLYFLKPLGIAPRQFLVVA